MIRAFKRWFKRCTQISTLFGHWISSDNASLAWRGGIERCTFQITYPAHNYQYNQISSLMYDVLHQSMLLSVFELTHIVQGSLEWHYWSLYIFNTSSYALISVQSMFWLVLHLTDDLRFIWLLQRIKLVYSRCWLCWWRQHIDLFYINFQYICSLCIGL